MVEMEKTTGLVEQVTLAGDGIVSVHVEAPEKYRQGRRCGHFSVPRRSGHLKARPARGQYL